MKKNKVRIIILGIVIIYAILYISIKIKDNTKPEISSYEHHLKVNEFTSKEEGKELEDNDMHNGGGTNSLFVENKQALLQILNTDEMLIISNKIELGIEYINKLFELNSNESQFDKEEYFNENAEYIDSILGIKDLTNFSEFFNKISSINQDDTIVKISIDDNLVNGEEDSFYVTVTTSKGTELKFNIMLNIDDTNTDNSKLNWS